MPRFLIEGSYAPEGAKGLVKEGGTHRRAFIAELIKKSGGTMESFDFAFGASDVYVLCEMPDVASAMALSLAVNASGAVSIKTIPLISADEMDAAAKKQIAYRPPGAS
jgi:uncharacterized protein with GYD domain